MKLAISSLAWTQAEWPEALKLLRSYGIKGIELAPTTLWPTWEFTAQDAINTRTALNQSGFEVPAMQSILYGVSANIFKGAPDQLKMKNHLRKVMDLAHYMGTPVLVWGAPASRKKEGLTLNEAILDISPILADWGDMAYSRKTCVCIEPNPRSYACDFINTAQEGQQLVQQVNSKGFGLHLDLGGLLLEGAPLNEEMLKTLNPRHVHLSAEQLGSFQESPLDLMPQLVELKKTGYTNWVSLEMRPLGLNTLEKAIIKAKDLMAALA